MLLEASEYQHSMGLQHLEHRDLQHPEPRDLQYLEHRDLQHWSQRTFNTWSPGTFNTWSPVALSTSIPGALNTWSPGAFNTCNPGAFNTWIPGAFNVLIQHCWWCTSFGLNRLQTFTLLMITTVHTHSLYKVPQWSYQHHLLRCFLPRKFNTVIKYKSVLYYDAPKKMKNGTVHYIAYKINYALTRSQLIIPSEIFL